MSDYPKVVGVYQKLNEPSMTIVDDKGEHYDIILRPRDLRQDPPSEYDIVFKKRER